MPAIDYEVTYILRPALEETDMDARVETIAESLKANGGEVVGEIEKLGKRRLAYEIDDVREGYYVVMKFKSEAAASQGARAPDASQRRRHARPVHKTRKIVDKLVDSSARHLAQSSRILSLRADR